MPGALNIQSFRVKTQLSLHPCSLQEAELNSICPSVPLTLMSSLDPHFLPFSPFIYSKNLVAAFSPALRKYYGSYSSVWLGIVSLFHCVDPALWVSSASCCSHETEGPPLRLGLPRASAAVSPSDGHPQGPSLLQRCARTSLSGENMPTSAQISSSRAGKTPSLLQASPQPRTSDWGLCQVGRAGETGHSCQVGRG